MFRDTHHPKAIKLALRQIKAHPGEYMTKSQQDELLRGLITQHDLKYTAAPKGWGPREIRPLTVDQYRRWFQNVAQSRCTKKTSILEIFNEGFKNIKTEYLLEVGLDDEDSNENSQMDRDVDSMSSEIAVAGKEEGAKEAKPNVSEISSKVVVRKSMTGRVLTPTEKAFDAQNDGISNNPEIGTVSGGKRKAETIPAERSSKRSSPRGATTTQDDAPTIPETPGPETEASEPTAAISVEAEAGSPSEPQHMQAIQTQVTVSQEKGDSTVAAGPIAKKRKVIVDERVTTKSWKFPACFLGRVPGKFIRHSCDSIFTIAEQDAPRWCKTLGIDGEQKAVFDKSSLGLQAIYKKLFGPEWKTRMVRLSGTGHLTAYHLIRAVISAAVFQVFDMDISAMPWKGPKAKLEEYGKYYKGASDERLARMGEGTHIDIMRRKIELIIWESAGAIAEDKEVQKEVIHPFANELAGDLMNLLIRQTEILGSTKQEQQELFWFRRQEYMKEAFVRALVLRQTLEASRAYFELDWIQSGAEVDLETMGFVEDHGDDWQKDQREVLWAVTPMVVVKFASEDETWLLDNKAQVYSREEQPQLPISNWT